MWQGWFSIAFDVYEDTLFEVAEKGENFLDEVELSAEASSVATPIIDDLFHQHSYHALFAYSDSAKAYFVG